MFTQKCELKFLQKKNKLHIFAKINIMKPTYIILILTIFLWSCSNNNSGKSPIIAKPATEAHNESFKDTIKITTKINMPEYVGWDIDSLDKAILKSMEYNLNVQHMDGRKYELQEDKHDILNNMNLNREDSIYVLFYMPPEWMCDAYLVRVYTSQEPFVYGHVNAIYDGDEKKAITSFNGLWENHYLKDWNDSITQSKLEGVWRIPPIAEINFRIAIKNSKIKRIDGFYIRSISK